MADAFFEHHQQVDTGVQRRMRSGARNITRGRGEMRTTGEKRGARGGAGRGSRNRDGMSVVSKTRGNRDGTRKRGGARDVDGIRSQKKVRAGRISRKKNIDEVAVEIESDADLPPVRNGRGGGRKNGLAVDGAAGGGGRNRKKSDGELPERSKIKIPKGESMASAIVKTGITLVPVGSAASDNRPKRKAGKGGI